MDNATRPTYGPLTPGRPIEVAGRAVTIGGTYDLGTGFVGLGVALVGDQEFLRLFPQRTLAGLNLGLLTLRPGADADAVAARLRARLPADVDVYTRETLTSHEVSHWVVRTSTGLVFGFGVAVAFIVGSVILYQTLATQISALDDDMAAAVLAQLSPRQASAIFNEIVPDRAAKLAGLIAGTGPIEDKK